jgi:hypothetical protein
MSQSFAFLADVSPVVADILIEDPVVENSKMVLGLVAAVAGVVILYLIVRKKRS